MRGTSPIDLPVPLSGWVGNVPLHRMPQDALICRPGVVDSFNCFVDFDGLLKPRFGYDELHNFGERVMGGLFWTDSTGTAQIFVITLHHAWWLQTDHTWLEITGSGINCAVDAPARIVQFGADHNTIYWVNGVRHDTLRRWVLGDATYTDMPDPSSPYSGKLAAMDLAAIGDRLVLVNTEESDGFHPSRVRWSKTLDGTLYPALAYNDLLDADAGALMAIRAASRTTAVLYTQNGPPSSMSESQGSDASAFAFDRVQGGKDGPVSAVAITNVGGRHYYVAGDQHIYQCDGSSCESISPRIDAFLASSSGLVMGEMQHPVALYDKRRQKIWFFVAFHGDEEARHAVCADLARTAWEPPQVFPDGITAAFTLLEQMGPTWDNPGTDALGNDYTWDTAPWTSWDMIPADSEPAMYLGTADGRLLRFFQSSTDRGRQIPWSATWALVNPGALNDLRCNAIDIQVDPQANLILPSRDAFHVALRGLRTPYDPASQLLHTHGALSDTPETWYQQLSKKVGEGVNVPANYLRLQLTGTASTNAPWIAGVTLYAFVNPRGDKGGGYPP